MGENPAGKKPPPYFFFLKRSRVKDCVVVPKVGGFSVSGIWYAVPEYRSPFVSNGDIKGFSRERKEETAWGNDCDVKVSQFCLSLDECKKIVHLRNESSYKILSLSLLNPKNRAWIQMGFLSPLFLEICIQWQPLRTKLSRPTFLLPGLPWWPGKTSNISPSKRAFFLPPSPLDVIPRAIRDSFNSSTEERWSSCDIGSISIPHGFLSLETDV